MAARLGSKLQRLLLAACVSSIAACTENSRTDSESSAPASVSLRSETAVAAPGEVSHSAAYQRYLRSLDQVVNESLIYPYKAARDGEQGSAKVEVHFLRNGRILQVDGLQSTGSRELDDEVAQVFARIANFPRVPDDVEPGAERLILAMPISFSLSR